MATSLVVVQPFADYAKGDRITDSAKIEEILKDHRRRVVPIQAEDAPAPSPSPAPAQETH